MFNLLAMVRGSFEPHELIKSKTMFNILTIPLEYINRPILLLILFVISVFAFPSIHNRHNNILTGTPKYSDIILIFFKLGLLYPFLQRENALCGMLVSFEI